MGPAAPPVPHGWHGYSSWLCSPDRVTLGVTFSSATLLLLSYISIRPLKPYCSWKRRVVTSDRRKNQQRKWNQNVGVGETKQAAVEHK